MPRLAGEDLILAHVHADDCIVIQHGTQLAQDGAGENVAFALGEDAAQLGLAVVPQLSQPCGGVANGDLALEDLIEDDLHIAHQRDGGGHVLADLGGVNINVDGGHPLFDVAGVDQRTVCGSGTHHDEQVGVGQCLIGTVVAVGADHAQIQGVIGGQDGQAHHGLDHGDGAALGQLHQFLLGACQPDTAAGTDQRLTGAGDGVHYALDLQFVALGTGLIAADVDFFGVCKLFDILILDINGNVDEDGAGTAGGGDVESLLDDAGDVVGVLHQIAVLGEGSHGAGDVHFLEDIAAQQMAGDLTGDGHHGDGVHIGRGDAGDEVGCAGTGGDHTHAYLAADTGIAGGHVACVLLGAHEGIADFRMLLQGIYGGADGGAGITENVIDAFLQQTEDQCLCSVHMETSCVRNKKAALPYPQRIGRSRITPWYHLNSWH